MSSTHIAAILVANQEWAGHLSEELAGEGVEAILIQNSDEFYRVLNYQRVDLVVVENELNGFLSGLEILERLYNDLLRPATILLANLNFDQQERAGKLGIDVVLRSGSSVATVKEASHRLLTTSSLSQVVIPPEARKLVQQSDLIRPLPQLIIKLCGYLSKEDVSIAELAKDISVDPRITAELLKITNSTATGLRCKVSKVFDAVNFLGVERTITLVLSASVISTQTKMLRTLPEPVRVWYHQRSVLIASTASTFARHLEQVSPDSAYVLGLLQDLGILVLAHAFTQRYLQLLQRVREVGQLRLEITEKQDFRVTHAAVSAALLQKWDLPQSLISMVLNHHDPETFATRSKTDQRFLHVMQIGEAVANLTDLRTPQRYHLLGQLLGEYGEAKADQCRACLAEAVAKTAESSELFGIPVPEEAALKQLLGRVSLDGQEIPAADRPPVSESPAKPHVAQVAAPGASHAPKSAASEHPAPGRRRVLVIDDEPAVVKMVDKFLTPSGFQVFSCTHHETALELAPQIDIVLCDVHLDGESGIDIVRVLRRSGFAGPIIVISGDRTRSTVAECLEVGINDYLLKPFNKATLSEKLNKWLASPSNLPAPVASAG